VGAVAGGGGASGAAGGGRGVAGPCGEAEGALGIGDDESIAEGEVEALALALALAGEIGVFAWVAAPDAPETRGA
jgi:hypothetical protein